LLLFLLASCGPPQRAPGSYKDGASSTSHLYVSPNGGGYVGADTSSATENTDSGSGTTSTGKLPVYKYRVEGTGSSYTVNVSVQAGQQLRVRFTPGKQDRYIKNTTTYAVYSKLGVYLGVGGTVQPTEMLSNGAAGGSAEKSRVIDFSSAISGCRASSTCRQSVKITVTQANNDYACINTGMSCPWARVAATHPWWGMLEVQTDDTESL
jgi:hypothetical protein